MVTLDDFPEADGTDAAHPAWWRGNDAAVEVLCIKVNEILDGKDSGSGVARDPWESTRRRLLSLTAARAEPVAGDWQTVPKVPTEEMRKAWNTADGNSESYFSYSGYDAMLAAAPGPVEAPERQVVTNNDTHAFKNFHRLLCERFGYCHDEKDWRRDQISLIEHIAALAPAPQTEGSE